MGVVFLVNLEVPTRSEERGEFVGDFPMPRLLLGIVFLARFPVVVRCEDLGDICGEAIFLVTPDTGVLLVSLWEDFGDVSFFAETGVDVFLTPLSDDIVPGDRFEALFEALVSPLVPSAVFGVSVF